MKSRPAAPEAVSTPAAVSRDRERRAAGWRWALGIAVALGFHGALIALTRVTVSPNRRADPVDPRIAWVGDKVVMEEDSMRGQAMALFDDAPLFLPTALNYAGSRRSIADTTRPGEIFPRDEPVYLVAVNQSPEGLVVAPVDRMDPVGALERFRWPYFTYFGRDDLVVPEVERRLARMEVRSAESGALVLATSIAPEPGPELSMTWPDWRPCELFITLSETGPMSDPISLGSGSGSDVVDRFLRGLLRDRLRLDLRLSPGNYRVTFGP